MQRFSHRVETLEPGRVTRHALLTGNQVSSYRQVLDLLLRDGAFRQFLSGVLASSEFVSFRWETPPITLGRIDRPFEFVLVNDPQLDGQPGPEVFQAHFDEADDSALVLAIPNLGRTATLVVPRPLDAARAYPHIAAFVRTAPEPQQHALWQCVAATAYRELSDRPMWISTAGGGVAWLHVRLEGVPKYYAYRPYAHAT